MLFKNYKRSKKGVEMKIVNWILALIILGILTYIIYINWDYLKVNLKHYTSCEGVGVGEGKCMADNECNTVEGVKLITPGCTQKGQVCCITDKDAVSNYFGGGRSGGGGGGADYQPIDPSRIDPNLQSCNWNDNACSSECRAGISEIKYETNNFKDLQGRYHVGPNNPFWITAIVSTPNGGLYPGITNCISENRLTIYANTRTSGRIPYTGVVSCTEDEARDNWKRFKCTMNWNAGRIDPNDYVDSVISITPMCGCSNNREVFSSNFVMIAELR